MILSDARTALQDRRGDRSYSAAALNRFLNQARADIASRHRWSWLRRPWTFSTRAKDSTTLTAAIFTQYSRTVTTAITPPVTLWGKRIVVNGRVYRVENLTSNGLGWTLDQPFVDASAAYAAVVLYDEIALPRGAETVLEVTLLPSGNAPQSLRAIGPDEMLWRQNQVYGQPNSYAVMRREPIPSPVLPLTAAMVVNGAGTGPESGVHLYWFSCLDKQTGAESGLSPSLSHTAAGVSVAVTPTSAIGRRDFLMRFYRSKTGTTVPYHVADGTTFLGAVTDSLLDNYLGPRAPESGSSIFLRLDPAPDGAYQVDAVVQMRDADLGENNDRPLFDDVWAPTWLDGAEALMLEAADEQGRANQARQRYEAGIRRMTAQDNPTIGRIVEIGSYGRRVRGRPTTWYGAGGP